MDISTFVNDLRSEVITLLLSIAANSLDVLIEETGIEISQQQYTHALITGFYRMNDFVPPQRPGAVSAAAEAIMN